MNNITIKEKLERGLPVYMMDDFLDSAIRMTFDGRKTYTFLKHKGVEEVQIPTSAKICFDIRNGGVEITKEQYESY